MSARDELATELRELAKSCGFDHGTPTGKTAWDAARIIEADAARLAMAREALRWLRTNYAGAPTREINARIDATLTALEEGK